MLPFLGYGQEGAERGVKLALIGMSSLLGGPSLAEAYCLQPGSKKDYMILNHWLRICCTD